MSANVLGVTQTLWDTVINCRGGKSIQFWTQFAFRAGSGKHDWRVIDFVPTRALESLRETFCMANDLNPTLSEYDFTDFVPIHEWNDEWRTMTDGDINSVLAADISSTTRLMTGGTEGLDIAKLMDTDIDIIDGFAKEVTKRVTLNEENNNNDTAKKRVDEMTAAEKTDLQKKIQSVKALLALIPQVILEERATGTNINTIDDVLNAETYGLVTDDSGVLRELLAARVLSSRALSRRVMLTSTSIDHSLTELPVSTVLNDLQISTGVSQGIPVELLDSMV